MKIWFGGVLAVVALVQWTNVARADTEATADARPWPDAVEARLELAGTNRLEIGRAFKEAAVERREGLSFLVENIPAGRRAGQVIDPI